MLINKIKIMIENNEELNKYKKKTDKQHILDNTDTYNWLNRKNLYLIMKKIKL